MSWLLDRFGRNQRGPFRARYEAGFRTSRPKRFTPAIPCGHVEEYVNFGGETVGPFVCSLPLGHDNAHSDGHIGWYGGPS